MLFDDFKRQFANCSGLLTFSQRWKTRELANYRGIITFEHVAILFQIRVIYSGLLTFSQRWKTVGFHNFNLRIFNLRVSNPSKSIVDAFLTRCRISMCQGLGPKKHDEIAEIDRIPFANYSGLLTFSQRWKTRELLQPPPLRLNQHIQYNTIHYTTLLYNTIQYNTIQYNTIQYDTIHYKTMQTILGF